MSTTKQKRVAKLIIENVQKDPPLTDIEILKRSNYSTTTSETKSTKVIKSEGVQNALKDYGFNEDNAKKVVSEIMLDKRVKPDSRLKATDQVFKVHGSYEDTKNGANRMILINVPKEVMESYGIDPTPNTSNPEQKEIQSA